MSNGGETIAKRCITNATNYNIKFTSDISEL